MGWAHIEDGAGSEVEAHWDRDNKDDRQKDLHSSRGGPGFSPYVKALRRKLCAWESYPGLWLILKFRKTKFT